MHRKVPWHVKREMAAAKGKLTALSGERLRLAVSEKEFMKTHGRQVLEAKIRLEEARIKKCGFTGDREKAGRAARRIKKYSGMLNGGK